MKNLKTISRVCLYTAIGLPVIFFFLQAMGLAQSYRNPDPDFMIGQIKSMYLIFPLMPASILLWAIAFGLMTKAKGYNNIISFLVFFVSLITIVGAVVYFFLPDKLKSASP